MKCRWEKQVQVWLAGEQVWLRGDGKFCGTTRGRLSQLSLHPSVQRVSGLGSQQESPNLPPPSHYYQLLQGNPKAFPGQLTPIIFPTCPTSTSPEWTPLKGRPDKMLEPHQPHRLIWRCRSRSSTLSSFWMSELLTPLSLSPAPPTKEPFGAACTCTLLFWWSKPHVWCLCQ